MKFTIKPLKEEKYNIIVACLIVVFLPIIGIGLLATINWSNDLYIVLIVWFVVGCLISLIMLGSIQSYLVDNEKIIVKNYFGKVNEVYFCRVQHIVDIELPIVKRDYVRCFIFIDKMENIDDKVFWGNTTNYKFSFVRVPVNKELIEHLERLNLIEKIFIPKKIF